MITLITGVPGAGKTLYTVDELLTPVSDSDRQLFVDGIPDLLLRHDVAQDPLLWPDWAPDGAMICIDEVQRVWRPEAAGKAPHASIAALETHRHRGLDFVIMTQHPNLLHNNVRRLVGRHIHLRRTSLGVYLYEWSECVVPDSAWKTAVVKTKWSHPKRSFGKYKSAEIHNKVKFRIPRAVWVLGFCAVSVLAMGTYLGRSIYSSMFPQAKPQQVQHVTGSSSQTPAMLPVHMPAFDLPMGSSRVYLSGLSVQRQSVGAYLGVVVFELDIAGNRFFITDEELSALGYRVLAPSDNAVALFDPKGRRLIVSYEPRKAQDVEPVTTAQQGQTAQGCAEGAHCDG